jgi:hypothetical protein
MRMRWWLLAPALVLCMLATGRAVTSRHSIALANLAGAVGTPHAYQRKLQQLRHSSKLSHAAPRTSLIGARLSTRASRSAGSGVRRPAFAVEWPRPPPAKSTIANQGGDSSRLDA